LRFYIIIFSICLAIACVLQIATYKHNYNNDLAQQRQNFIQQQQDLMSRIARQLSYPIARQETHRVEEILLAYENVLFALDLPVVMQVVLLDAPQAIIGNADRLHADYNYYQRILANPNKIHFSDLYDSTLMPDFKMLNYGIGILDDAEEVTAVLEVTIADEKFDRIVNQVTGYSLQSYIIKVVTAYALLALFVTSVFAYFFRQQMMMRKELKMLQRTVLIGSSKEYEQKGQMHFDLFVLLSDLYAKFFSAAKDMNVSLLWPQKEKPYYIYADRQDIMHDLSGIVANMLRNNANEGTLKLSISLEDGNVMLNAEDDAYYSSLDEEWGILSEKVEYIHQPYIGNKIKYLICKARSKASVIPFAQSKIQT